MQIIKSVHVLSTPTPKISGMNGCHLGIYIFVKCHAHCVAPSNQSLKRKVRVYRYSFIHSFIPYLLRLPLAIPSFFLSVCCVSVCPTIFRRLNSPYMCNLFCTTPLNFFCSFLKKISRPVSAPLFTFPILSFFYVNLHALK